MFTKVCPAHRTMIVRKLKGLEDIIPFTSVHWSMLEKGEAHAAYPNVVQLANRSTGWRFATKDENEPGENTTPDPLHPEYTHLRQIYFEKDPDYSGRFTVPTLYDKKQGRIVSNESSEIIRMFYHVFDDLLPEKYAKLDLLPNDLKDKIDQANEWTYNDVNNGMSVSQSGFAYD